MSSIYRVKLENFEGPLDLLLFFIKRDELNIYDIPIARITKEFLSYVQFIQQLDLDIAGDFLLMAATLMQIKVRMLLPNLGEDEDEPDPREELIKRLLEYKRFKEVSETFKKLEDKQSKIYFREYFKQDEIEAKQEDVNLLKEVSMFDLLKSFKKVLDNLNKNTVFTVEKIPVSIEEQIDYIKYFFGNRKQYRFLELISNYREKMTIIVTFIAILEMIKDSQIRIYTKGNYNDMIIYKVDSKIEEGLEGIRE
jgi:segregation and condensation protein A